MKRKLLKKLGCLFGMLFITFPAWSAVPSNLLPRRNRGRGRPVRGPTALARTPALAKPVA